PASAQQALTYWTEERMQNASPMPLSAISQASPLAQSQVETVPPGPMVIADAGDPEAKDALLAEPREAAPPPVLLPGLEPQAGTYPFSYTRYWLFPFTQYKVFPYR